MHKSNVLILGSDIFISTLNELNPFLKFNSHFVFSNNKYDVIIFHIDALRNQENKNIIDQSNLLRICAYNGVCKMNNYEAYLKLPTTLKEINSIVAV